MIDTGMLSLVCYKENGYFESFVSEKHTEEIIKSKKVRYINDYFINRGIHILGSQVDKGIYVITARLNFHKLVNNDGNRVQVGTEKDIDIIENNFNSVMDILGLPHFNKWSVLRIDYCINIYTENVTTYLNLLKKGIRRKFLRDPYMKEKERVGQRKDSLYLIPRSKKNGSRNINIYDKLGEIENRHGAAGLPEDSRRILRLEVQCFKSRLRRIKDREGLRDMSPRNFLSYDIALGEIRLALKELTHSESDYYKKSIAVKTIKSKKGIWKGTKKRLTEAINYIIKYQWGMERYRVEVGTEEFNKLLGAFKRLDINPVTIPDAYFSPSSRNPLYDVKDKCKIESIFKLLERQESNPEGLPEDITKERFIEEVEEAFKEE